jgi:hypothetical protein
LQSTKDCQSSRLPRPATITANAKIAQWQSRVNAKNTLQNLDEPQHTDTVIATTTTTTTMGAFHSAPDTATTATATMDESWLEFIQAAADSCIVAHSHGISKESADTTGTLHAAAEPSPQETVDMVESSLQLRHFTLGASVLPEVEQTAKQSQPLFDMSVYAHLTPVVVAAEAATAAALPHEVPEPFVSATVLPESVGAAEAVLALPICKWCRARWR